MLANSSFSTTPAGGGDERVVRLPLPRQSPRRLRSVGVWRAGRSFVDPRLAELRDDDPQLVNAPGDSSNSTGGVLELAVLGSVACVDEEGMCAVRPRRRRPSRGCRGGEVRLAATPGCREAEVERADSTSFRSPFGVVDPGRSRSLGGKR